MHARCSGYSEPKPGVALLVQQVLDTATNFGGEPTPSTSVACTVSRRYAMSGA